MKKSIKIIILLLLIIIIFIVSPSVYIYIKYYKDKILADGRHVKWYPDGSKISHVKGRNLYLIDINTKKEQLVLEGNFLETGTGYDIYDWFPNKNKIAYLATKPELLSQDFDIVIFDFNSKQTNTIVQNVVTSQIDISPDGSKILYSHVLYESSDGGRKFSDDSGVYIVNVDGSNNRKILSYKDEDGISCEYKKCSWTPDSSGIVIQQRYRDDSYYFIDVSSGKGELLDTKTTKDIISNCLTYAYDENIYPSPDGTRYLYQWHKGSDMGPGGRYRTDYYLKKSEKPICIVSNISNK